MKKGTRKELMKLSEEIDKKGWALTQGQLSAKQAVADVTKA